MVRNAAAWVESAEGRRPEARGRPPRRPHAGDLLRGARHPARGTTPTPICLYGHLDKQPEFNGWRNDLGPWTPKYEDGLLYGRGGADDGYAVYAAITAIQALDGAGHRAAALRRPDRDLRGERLATTCCPTSTRCATRLGDVGLVVCLDTGAGNYDQLWLTTSLRGMVSGTLKVEILTEGMHSGDASGLVPSSFRILRQVLDRLEDRKTGRLLPAELPLRDSGRPRSRRRRPRRRSSATRSGSASPGPAAPTAARRLPTTTDPVEALLNRTWTADAVASPAPTASRR